jgi:hypothetical protein
MLVIPVKDYPSYTEEITLDGILYRLSFQWNYRGRHWTIDFYDADGNGLLTGVKIVKGYDLFGRFHNLLLPPGAMFALDEKGSYDRIEAGDLGNTVSLLYIPEDEVATL